MNDYIKREDAMIMQNCKLNEENSLRKKTA